MPNYVVLYRFTAQGRKNVKESVKRAAEIRKQNNNCNRQQNACGHQ